MIRSHGRVRGAATGRRASTRSALATALLLAVSSLITSTAEADIDRYLIDTGPLRVRDQFLPGLGYLAFDPVAADILDDGAWQVDAVFTISNTFAHSDAVDRLLESRSRREAVSLEALRTLSTDGADNTAFYLDGEHARWALALRRGIGHGLQVEFVLPVIHFGGGRLDSAIEGFHDAFSFGQAGRLGVHRNAFTAYLRSPRRETYVTVAPGTTLGDAVVGVRSDLWHGQSDSGIELALEFLAKLPTGDIHALTSSGSTDVGVQMIGTRYFRNGCLHFSVGTARLGPHRLLGLDAQTLLSGMLAWEFGLGAHTTALLQATISQSPFEALRSQEIRKVSTQLTVGVKRSIGPNVLFAGLTENLANFNNSADIGLHIGVTRGFGGPSGRTAQR